METLVRGDGRRIVYGKQIIRAFHYFAAGMEKLREDRAALGMADIGKLSVTLDAGVFSGHQHM
ncbi:hypothetical protein [Mesorhizobium sp. M0047]|uniref:hypothetical protein n=1 Tax=Mesorhizobium sp. M0047 TaxID=2956859 RepID=UPI003339B83D